MTGKVFSVWEKHKLFIEQISRINHSFVFVLELENRQERQCLFLSNNFIDFFGYEKDQLIKDKCVFDFDYLISYMHPDDAEVFWLTQRSLLDFLYSQSQEEMLSFKHVFELRFRQVNGDWVRVISQHQVLELNENGEPWIVFGIMDVSPDQVSDGYIKLRLVNFKTGAVVPFPLAQKEQEISLTLREREVLDMIRKGFLSKEISEKLSISIHTVNNHRKNILEKMHVDNAFEAIHYAQKLGLLE